MSQSMAEKYASSMKQLVNKARDVSRDINPREQLRNLRIRTKTREILVSHDKEFIVILIQQWTPAAEAENLVMATMQNTTKVPSKGKGEG
mmetsp:Transcript_35806/g.52309  ORF Transcript_35806/g.52309 Transcript_35806/m.52309 type:complete len:90 (-) Transcript_35806:165-434(-)